MSTPVDKLPQRSIKESVGKSADEIKKTISDAAEKLPEPAKNIINSDAMKDLAEKGQNMMDSLKAKGDELAAVRSVDRKERVDEAKIALDAALTNERNSEAMFSVRDALRIMYSLMLYSKNSWSTSATRQPSRSRRREWSSFRWRQRTAEITTTRSMIMSQT